MFERTAMMVTWPYFKIDDGETVVGSVVFTVAFLAVHVSDIILHLLLVSIWTLFVVYLPESGTILHGQSSSLQKHHKLHTSLVPKVLLFGGMVVEVEHTGRETLLSKEIKVGDVDLVF